MNDLLRTIFHKVVSRTSLISWVGASTVCAIAGPFQTFALDSFGFRILFWFSVNGLATVMSLTSDQSIRHFFPNLRPLYCALLAGTLFTVSFTLVLQQVIFFSYGPVTHPSFGFLLLVTSAVTISIYGATFVYRHALDTAVATEVSGYSRTSTRTDQFEPQTMPSSPALEQEAYNKDQAPMDLKLNVPIDPINEISRRLTSPPDDGSQLHTKAPSRTEPINGLKHVSPVAFLRLVGLDQNETLVRLAMHDHYIEVCTLNTQTMVHMRFKDALDHLVKVNGAQVHRSHWVNFPEISDVEKSGGKISFLMTDGFSVPISRTRRPALKAIGLL